MNSVSASSTTRPPTSMLDARMASRTFDSVMSNAFQAARIDDDAVLPHEAADARDLGHALGLGDGKAHLPVLRRAQSRRACASAAMTAY